MELCWAEMIWFVFETLFTSLIYRSPTGGSEIRKSLLAGASGRQQPQCSNLSSKKPLVAEIRFDSTGHSHLETPSK